MPSKQILIVEVNYRVEINFILFFRYFICCLVYNTDIIWIGKKEKSMKAYSSVNLIKFTK